MRKSVKLMTLSAIALGLASVSPVFASNINDLNNANSQLNSELHKSNSSDDSCSTMEAWAAPFEGSHLSDEIATLVNKHQATEANIRLLLKDSSAYDIGQGLKADKDSLDRAYNAMSPKDKQNGAALYKSISNELDAIYGLVQDGNDQQANASSNQNADKQNANNNANTQAQSTSSSEKDNANVTADTNSAVKGTNKQASSNQTAAQQGVAKNNGTKAEGQKAVIANENQTSSSNSTKTQNKDNGAIAETQAQNTTATGETSAVVKTQTKSENNNASQKDNTPVFPQTGEKTSEILAVAGGLIIAATATGIVVYKKRN